MESTKQMTLGNNFELASFADDKVAPAGQYSYPFRITVPLWLPPSTMTTSFQGYSTNDALDHEVIVSYTL